MHQVHLENYRCFQEKQTVRLAPLTLLVGENSTGKTSFLALLRALRETGYGGRTPSFRKPPYDLGTFREIVHSRRLAGRPLKAFSAGFESTLPGRDNRENASVLKFHAEFKNRDADPYPATWRYTIGSAWLERISDNGSRTVRFGTDGQTWELHLDDVPATVDDLSFLVHFDLFSLQRELHQRPDSIRAIKGRQSAPDNTDIARVRHLMDTVSFLFRSADPDGAYAGAPVRSSPRRVYDPPNPGRDPEGEYIPLYLARTRYQDNEEWARLKGALEQFGRNAGLFDNLDVKPLDAAEGGPFQLRIRKAGQHTKGPNRNIADVGYGVSQVLPVVTELLRRNVPEMYLLQQPEVHLHPSAQAALGTLFCSIAGSRRTQLVVETHSDHLIDRVRMDVRDRRTELSPEDVSILYFERVDLAVRIHELRLDKVGNVLDAPDSYGQFFMDETARSLNLGT